MGKINYLLKNFIIVQETQRQFPAQPQQNPKSSNYIKETHEQVQAITSLRSEKEIEKTIALKRVNQGAVKSRELGGEIKRKKSEEDRKESEEKEREHNSEPSKKASNEITIEDLKHAHSHIG